MFRIVTAACVAAVLAVPALAEDKGDTKVSGPLSFTLKDIKGNPVALSKYEGKVLLLVNVASECGLTPQYEGLQSLYEKYQKDGFVVIGIPANEFGRQEPGTNEEIEKFCTSKYKVTFPMMSKIVVKGDGIDPLYKYLTDVDTKPQKAGAISWNFEKFVVGKDGKVVARFNPRTTPSDPKLVETIESELKK